ncbi:uncharacterized protein LOC133814605 [Humulus lupulus]|uniref:uncharacterized protein LOC133814605 n=1 Tax=Humulus lupulus TaxID=3486 RepID=UPI002B408B2D|nr:uncharacterized protein LOC133814605 [Humulus lupulus]
MVHTRFSSASPASQTNIPNSKSNMKYAVAYVSEARVKRRLYNCKHEVRKAKRTKKSQLIIEEPCEYAPKGMNFLIHPDNRCSSKIASTIKYSQIQAIHEKLSKKQVSDFGDSCFGHFLTLPEFTMQHQLIHNLLLRELQQPNKLEIWAGVNGMKLRFGMREFALVTGLWCFGSTDKMKYVSKDNGLYSTYFKDHFKINNKIVVKNSKKESNKDGKKKDKAFYRLLGFPYAFQVWFFECCPYLNGRYCHLSQGSIPRIVKWSSNIQPSFAEVTELLSLNVAELKLRNIYPTSKERENSEIKSLFPKEKEDIEVDIGVPDNVRVAQGLRATNSRVDALGDDDFVETPPRSVASGSSPSLPTIHPHSDVGGCSSLTSEMPHVSLSSMHAQLRALEACNKRLEESNTRLEASNKKLEESHKIVINELSSLKSHVHEGFLNLHNLFSSHFVGKQDSHDIEEDDNTNIVDDEMVENNSKEEDEKEEDESEEEEVHQSEEDNDESDDDDDDDEDNAKCVGEDNDDEEEEKDDNHEKYNGGNKDEDSKVELILFFPSQVAQVDEVASHVAGEVVDAALKVAGEVVDFQVAKDPEVAGVATEVAEAVVEDPKVSFLDSLSDIELDKAIQNAYKAVDAMKATGVTSIPCTTIVPYVGSSESNLGYVTPALPKRTIKLPPCLQSPFLQTFCSCSGESSVIQSTGGIKVVKGLCPLDEKIGELPDFVTVQEFYVWLDKGMKSNNKSRLYSKEDNLIIPGLQLGVDVITKKMWFHALQYSGQPILKSHVDVVFYYLRKKGMYRDSTVLKFTTTDTTFQKRIEAIYDSFLKKNHGHGVMNRNHVVVEVMMGFGLSCNKSWLQSCDRKDHVALLAIEPFRFLLPTYLSIIGFYERTDIDFSSKPYVGRPQASSFEVVMDDDIPSGSLIDSAIYMFSFAEYFIGRKEIPRCDFDVEFHRSRLAYLLYSYAMGKQECGYESAREYALS